MLIVGVSSSPELAVPKADGPLDPETLFIWSTLRNSGRHLLNNGSVYRLAIQIVDTRDSAQI